MTKDIVTKLNIHLSKPIESECSAVYLLAEIRKLIELEKPNLQLFALKMYCNWALHVNLDKSRTTLPFLSRIDNYVINRVAGYRGNNALSFTDEHELFLEFLYLDTFRKELQSFLEYYNINHEICIDDKLWFAFLEAYGGVIEDGTLTVNSVDDLIAVEKVIFMKGAPLPSEYHVPFTIQWEILLKDKRTLRAIVKAITGTKMFINHISLLPEK